MCNRGWGGSKGVKGKNIDPFRKPLIAWTIEQAQNCSLIDHIVVSTDSLEIVQIVDLVKLMFHLLDQEISLW